MTNNLGRVLFIFMTIVVLGSLHTVYAKTISIIPVTNATDSTSTVKDHDVKFIVESALNTADWNPGVSKIANTNQKLLEYNTEGLKLYSLKGKVNLFDTDVFEIEKYGTFEDGEEQDKLLKQRRYDNDSSIEGLNISLHAFLIFKYFHLYDYDFLDGIEYQYDYYNFYAKAKNNIEAIYWWGKTDIGNDLEDYVRLPQGSTIELTTEFKEHRLYIADFKDYLSDFFIDSFKIGIFSTYWIRDSFVGITAENGMTPVIQSVLLESDGISFLAKHTIYSLNIDLKLRYNYGFNSFVVVSNTHYDADYTGIDFLMDYQYDIYDTNSYGIYTKLNAMYSSKWFDNAKYTLDTETIFSIGISLGVIF